MLRWMFLPYRRYFDFRGRSCRSEFWFFILWLFGFIMLGSMVSDLAGASGVLPSSLISGAFDSLIGLIIFGSIIPFFAVLARRFHDQGKSAWHVLLYFIPFVGGFVIIYFMVQAGEPFENSWGEDPLNPAPDAEIFA